MGPVVRSIPHEGVRLINCFIHVEALYSLVVQHKYNFSKGLLCLSTSGNYTQVEILTGNT